MKLMNYAACCIGFTMAASAVYAQPAADLCANAPTIGAGSYLVEIGDDDGHDGNFPSCSRKSGSTFYPDRDMWMKYVAPFSGQVTFGLTDCDRTDPGYGLGFNLSVWNACGGAQGGQITNACKSNGCNERINIQVIQGQSYLVRIASHSQTVTGPIHTGYTTLNITELAPPANDICAGAKDIGLGFHYFDDRSASFHGPLPSCSNTSDQMTQRDLFYAFTSPATATTYLEHGTPNGLVMSVREDTCTGPELVCDPPTNVAGNTGQLSFAAIAGQRYIIRIAQDAGRNPAPNKFFMIFQPPENETCETASTIVGPGSRDFSFYYAQAGSDEPYPTCGVVQDSTQRDVWYQYTAQMTGMASIRDRYAPNAQPTNGVGLTKSVYTGCVSGATQLTCSTGRVCFNITAGQSYWIRCASIILTPDFYAIDIEEYPLAAGDSCSTARVVNTGTTTWSNAGVCDRDPLEATTCGTSSANSYVWFAFTPAVTGHYSFSTRGTEADTVMQIFASCSAGSTPIACNDHISSNNNSKESYIPSIAINGGSTVYIVLSMASTPTFVTGDLTIENTATTLEAIAEITRGNGPLTQLQGPLSYYTDVKVYKINICDYSNFSATTYPSIFNTALFLFDADGYGVAFNEDTNETTETGVGARLTNQFINSNGEYYLAVAEGTSTYFIEIPLGRTPVSNGQPIWELEPRRLERDPDGPGAGGRFTGWTGAGSNFIEYTITLTGACPVQALCAADFNNDSARDVADLFAYINAWLAKTANADFNDDTTVDVADLFAYINAWLAGC